MENVVELYNVSETALRLEAIKYDLSDESRYERANLRRRLNNVLYFCDKCKDPSSQVQLKGNQTFRAMVINHLIKSYRVTLGRNEEVDIIQHLFDFN